MVGAAGASTLLSQTMTGALPLASQAAWAAPGQLPPGSGTGTSVLILGAGIAGLTAAYELHRAGYSCQILEAGQRAGGRSFTARPGSVVTEIGPGGGEVTQTCVFDENQYLNLGPGRLPYHHRRVLGYCHELGVALEPYVMETTANLLQTPDAFDGAPQLSRRIANDTRGYIAEMLTKAVNRGALDAELSRSERATLLNLLEKFGALTGGVYRGSTRSGYSQPLSVHQQAEPISPLALRNLLASRFWNVGHDFYQPVDFLWQPTMFQPVGGMDKIVEGFVAQLPGLIHYGSVVEKVTLTAEGVEVVGTRGGQPFQASADYCLSNIPFPVLKGIAAQSNFSAGYRAALDVTRYEPTCKVGWQANARFWENDTNQIYGGISRINHNITQMWYPSYDYFTDKGTLTGAYNFEQEALTLGELEPPQRLQLAREGAIRLHPEFSDETIVPTRMGLSIAWHKVPYQLGGWAEWKDTPEDRVAYGRLLSPDGRFHIIGDQVSPLPGWQEGAMMSAQYVIRQVAGLESASVLGVQRAPDSRSLTRGAPVPAA